MNCDSQTPPPAPVSINMDNIVQDSLKSYTAQDAWHYHEQHYLSQACSQNVTFSIRDKRCLTAYPIKDDYLITLRSCAEPVSHKEGCAA